MRRKVVLALCAGAIAAPIPVAALAQTGPDVGDVTAEAVMHKAELRKEARTAKRAAARRVAEKRQARKAAAAPAVADPASARGDRRVRVRRRPDRGQRRRDVSREVPVLRGDLGRRWAAVACPSQAPEAEQDMRAAMLYAQSGPGQWPVCGA